MKLESADIRLPCPAGRSLRRRGSLPALARRPSQRKLDARSLPNGKIIPESFLKSNPRKTQGQGLPVRAQQLRKRPRTDTRTDGGTAHIFF